MTTTAPYRKEKEVSTERLFRNCYQNAYPVEKTKKNVPRVRFEVKIFSFLNVFSNNVTIFKYLIGIDSGHYKYHPSAKF